MAPPRGSAPPSAWLTFDAHDAGRLDRLAAVTPLSPWGRGRIFTSYLGFFAALAVAVRARQYVCPEAGPTKKEPAPEGTGSCARLVFYLVCEKSTEYLCMYKYFFPAAIYSETLGQALRGSRGPSSRASGSANFPLHC